MYFENGNGTLINTALVTRVVKTKVENKFCIRFHFGEKDSHDITFAYERERDSEFLKLKNSVIRD